jgi:hypothetical protein
MADISNGFYMDLEQGLYFLRMHFEMCEGSKDSELLDWGRFFVEWSRKAAQECGSWSVANLEIAENVFETLQKSKTGLMGFEVLKRAMNDAAHSLNLEIKEALKGKKAGASSSSKKIAASVSVGDSMGFEDDTDQPQGRRTF